MDLKSFEVDLKKTDEGIWVPLDDEDGTELFLCRLSKPAYQRRMLQLEKPLLKAYRNREDIPAEKADDNAATAVSEHILLGWKNLKIGGKTIEYSKAKCYELLKDRRYVGFASLVLRLASDTSIFAPDDIEEDEKNSPAG